MKLYRQSIVFLLIYVSAFASPLNLLAQEDRNTPGLFLVNDYGGSGMFAVFGGVLGSLEHYENGNFAGIKIDIREGSYLDPELGPNWWEYFFEPIHIGDEGAPHYVCTINDHLYFAHQGFHMPRHRAFELIQRYIHVKPHIQKKVDEFVENNFDGYYVIGIHHRGTDKVLEMPLVSYEKTIATLNSVISQLTETQRANLRIFVSTDDAYFVSHMINIYPHQLIYNDHVRSDNGRPIHSENHDKFHSIYQKGEEALLDCLLLSRSNFLIRPWSSLSIISDHFNPNLPMITLWGDT
jgi:hypothetical protein